MTYFFLKNILFLALFMLYSCNNDGSVIYNTEEEHSILVTDEDGLGCSESTICYPLEEVYYDFSSGPLYQGFYKFDKAWSEGGFHDQSSDTLGLYTFNDSYLMAVPSNYIESDDAVGKVIISDNGSFVFEELDGLSGLPSELVNLVSQPPIPRLRDSLLVVSSNAFSNISNVVWNDGQLRYIPNTSNSETYSKSFYLTQEYDSIIQNTLIDTGNTPIIDDIVLLDYNEIVKRSVTMYDSLDNGNPVKSKRAVTFKVKNTFVSNDGPYWRESTDCNDNYQRDSEEIVMLDGFVNSYGVNPKSFESWCYQDACSAGGWLNEEDCCVNNSYGYGCTNGSLIDYNVSSTSLSPEEECCELNGGIWLGESTCLNESGDSFPNWDSSFNSDACDDNTSEAIMDWGEPWDDDGLPYITAFCQGYESVFSNENSCILNAGTWTPSSGTPDVPQTGAVGEPSIDDVLVGCTEGGVSDIGDFSDCDNSVENTSVEVVDYGPDWNHDSISGTLENPDYIDDYVPGDCLIENQTDCENEGFEWTVFLGDGFCSDNAFTEENCNYLWIPSVGTPNIPQVGDASEPSSDDSSIGCTNGGISQLGDYSDCDNSIANTSTAVVDYGTLNWNHDGIDYEEAFCTSYNEASCSSSCYNSSSELFTQDDFSACSGNDLMWVDLSWIPNSGTLEVAQTGAVGEPTIDDLAVGCTSEGVSLLGDFSDCSNSTSTWIYSEGSCAGSNYEWIWIDSSWDASTSVCSNSSANWDSTITLNVNSADLCSTECSNGNQIFTMDEFCWHYYDGNENYEYNDGSSVNHERLTGHCLVDDSSVINHSNFNNGNQYFLTFCDTGNNLFDPPEFYDDSNQDGFYTTGANFQEPFEDRNCNELLDGEGFNLNYSDLKFGDQGYIGNDEFVCDVSYGLSGEEGQYFCDRGNGQWDGPESYYCSLDEGINCEYNGDASRLFKRSDAPEVFLVNYEDWNSFYENYNQYEAAVHFLDNSIELRKPLTEINPSSNFEDTGIDGCFDELEDGMGGCLCEFKQDYGNDDSLIDCEQLMYQWYGDDLPDLWKKWHQIPKDSNGNYLSATIVITDFDLGLSEYSPFNYGECSNGFSGSLKDCCEYYSCGWSGDACNWLDGDCENDKLYCQNDIFFECEDDSDCNGEVGSCSSSKWIKNFDPNDDNYWSSDACYYDGTCEFDNNPPEKISSKSQSDDIWSYLTDDGTLDGEIVASEKTDLFSDGVNQITAMEYYSNPGLYSAYHAHVSLPDYIVTKKHLYSDGNNTGSDSLFVIDEEMKSVQVLVSDAIVESRNTIKSRKVIDQAGFDTNDIVHICEVADNVCSSTISSYQSCLEANFNSCESNLLAGNSSTCIELEDENNCLDADCIWGAAVNACSLEEVENSCYFEYDANKNGVCDSVEEFCASNEFDVCIEQLEEQLELSFYQDLLSSFYIMKTEYGYNDYDYLLFDKSSGDNVVQMTHPYYHYQSNNSIPTDYDDFICDGCTNFWENTLLKPDTLIYTYDGKIIEGQSFVSSESIDTENGLYVVDKTYEVSSGVAELEYPVYDPLLWNADCSDYVDSETCCGAGEECGELNNCSWNTPPEFDPGSFSPYCDNKSSSIISDCLIINRVVQTTTIGPGQGFRLRTRTYLKPGYKIVKETLEISWDTNPWLDENSNWSFVSGIEYRNNALPIQLSSNPDNFLVDYQTVNGSEFENLEDFNYSPFRLNKTMGIMRYE